MLCVYSSKCMANVWQMCLCCTWHHVEPLLPNWNKSAWHIHYILCQCMFIYVTFGAPNVVLHLFHDRLKGKNFTHFMITYHVPCIRGDYKITPDVVYILPPFKSKCKVSLPCSFHGNILQCHAIELNTTTSILYVCSRIFMRYFVNVKRCDSVSHVPLWCVSIPWHETMPFHKLSICTLAWNHAIYICNINKQSYVMKTQYMQGPFAERQLN